MAKQTPQDRKLFAILDPKEVSSLARELGISKTALIRLAMSINENGSPSRSIKKITDLAKKMKDVPAPAPETPQPSDASPAEENI